MTWVETLVVFRGVGARRLHSALSINWHSFLEEEAGTHVVVLPKFSGGRGYGQRTLKNLGRSPSAERRVHIGVGCKAREGPNTQERAERFMAATGHLSSTWNS